MTKLSDVQTDPEPLQLVLLQPGYGFTAPSFAPVNTQVSKVSLSSTSGSDSSRILLVTSKTTRLV